MSTSLNIHCLQHVPFEGPAGIADWLAARGHRLTFTHLYRGETLPTIEKFDWLVIMGGHLRAPLSPVVAGRETFYRPGDSRGKDSAGNVCLGAQLLADVLGGKVYQNMEKEIGWLPITLHDGAGKYFPGAPKDFTVFHWHGDTFSLPPGATCIASSAGMRAPGVCAWRPRRWAAIPHRDDVGECRGTGG